ncbi:sensor histidine kinase [Zavarzinella formosa]|uniref:sensor histidine kinase n=1 Tax=Zavarzinella formosa TaxID=360055 RepID=UPI0002E12ADB|nr:ATP-binding protein [Zavarzinella formosa]
MNSRLIAKLTAPLAALSVLLLVFAFGAAWYVRNLQSSMSNLLSINVASVRAAQDLEISIRESRTQFDRYLITGDKKHLEPIARLRERVRDALGDASDLATTLPEQALIKRIRAGLDHFFAEYEQLLNKPPPEGFYPKLIELSDTVLSREILEPAHEYLRLNEGVLARTSTENQELANRITVAMIGLGVCGAFGGVLAGWVMAVTLRRSMQRTEDHLRDTARQLSLAAHGEEFPTTTGVPGDAFRQVSESVSAVLQRLRRTEREALRAEQLAWVGQMAAGIAHEIRNPLMSIKLLVQAAADRRGGPALRPRDFEVLEDEIVRLEQIVADFLDFARPPRLDKRPVDPSALLQQTLDALRGRAELQAVRFRLDSNHSGYSLDADPNQLRQVVYNLAINAMDAMPAGGEVIVTCEQEADGGVLIAVGDSGPGLPPELGERIFEPFVSTKESGLGLGLSICRRIIESHGGRLLAENRPGGGAVFTIRLPAPTASLAVRADRNGEGSHGEIAHH